MSANFTDFGFVLGALAFAALALSLRPGARATGSVPRLRLRIAALFMVVWAVAADLAARAGMFDTALALLFSLSLVGVWVWQLGAYAALWRGRPPSLRLALQAGGAAVLVFSVGWMLAAARTPWVPVPTAAALALPGLALAVLGLFAIEQLYRNASVSVQPALRWLALGMAGMLLTELVMFAEILLLGTIQVEPGPVRGIAHALCALAMMRGAHLMPQWDTGLSVSRHVVFYASSFLLVGGYLVLMGLAGWLLLRYADGWNAVARIAFAALAVTGLALSLFSGGLFRRLRVLISTHLYPHRYDYRAEWMRFMRTMSEPDPAGVRQRAIRALAQIVDSPAGALWCREPGSQRYQCVARWPERPADTISLPADERLPEYLQRTGWLIDLTELAQRPDLYGDLHVDAGALQAAADALLVPLLHVDMLHGWVVLDRAPGKGDLDFEDRDLLKVAGRHVAAHLAQFDADAQLTEAQQFETYNRMTAFVMHDLKNIAAQLRLISQNAERHRRNPEFVEDAFRTVAAAAARMTKLIAQLGTGREAGTLQTLDLARCAERAVARCASSLPVPQVVAGDRPPVFADLEHLTAVIEHAIRNAQDATPAEGEVRVEVGVRDRRPLLTVADTGSGMDARFVHERLFRPFDTTKGARGMGIGAFQIREYMRTLGGEVEVRSEPGKGTRFSLVFADPSILAMDRKAG